MADDWRRRKRGIYSKAFKRRVVAETFEPGASVATVARDHGLNANMVFRWRCDPRFGPGKDAASFLPVEVISPAPGLPVDQENSGTATKLTVSLASGHDLSIVGPIDPDFVVRLAKGLSP